MFVVKSSNNVKYISDNVHFKSRVIFKKKFQTFPATLHQSNSRQNQILEPILRQRQGGKTLQHYE
jgi:hypothetical protein